MPNKSLLKTIKAFLGFNRTPSTHLLYELGKKLHEILIVVVGVFGLSYAVLYLLIGEWRQAIVSLLLLPAGVLGWLLFKRGNYLASKIWNLVMINAAILVLGLLDGPDAYAFIFYFPLLIGSIFVFQGKEQPIAYISALIIISSIWFLITTDIRLSEPAPNAQSNLWIERLANVVGVVIVMVFELIFIMRTSEAIQDRLIEKSEKLNDVNAEIMATIYARDRMMSVLSHDLRGPLFALDASLELILQGNTPTESQEPLLRALRQRTSETLHLMERMLLWSGSQNKTVIYTESKITLEQLERIIQTTISLIYNKKDISFHIFLENNGNLAVRGDKNMIEAIIRNLVTNAYKFSQPGGTVRISVAADQEECRIMVTDQGIGMDEDVLALLQSGETYSSRGTENERGHGIGLMLVREFLKMHDSNLLIETTPGKGSSFGFSLKNYTEG